MNIRYGRSAAALLAALTLGGTVAGCGSNTAAKPAATTDDAMAGMNHATTATSPMPITEASASDVDGAFVRQMIPHHQMAVSMAKMALIGAEHPQVKTLAKAIIAAQTTEISELQAVAKTLGVTPDKAMTDGTMSMSGSMTADAATLALHVDQMGMSMDMTKLDGAKPFDKAFIAQMTTHHKGAIAMAKAQLKRGANPKLRAIATAIIAAQEKEIAQMAAWNQQWYGAAAPASSPAHSSMPGM